MQGSVIRGALMALNGPHPAITPDWPDATRADEARPRSEGTGHPLAEILKVREAKGGGCRGEQGCRAHASSGSEFPGPQGVLSFGPPDRHKSTRMAA